MAEIKEELRPYIPLAQMLVKTFGADCEVVLHDLDNPASSVVYVENPSVTGRKLGESFEHLVEQVILSDELKEDFVANYYFTAPNGKYIRSSSLLIKDESGHLTGAMCINIDTSKLTDCISYLQSLLPAVSANSSALAETAEHSEIKSDPPLPRESHVAKMIEDLMDGILADCDPHSLSREKRIEKIRFMDQKGLFLMKGSVEMAAEKFGTEKVTIYSYIKEAQRKQI